MSNINIFDNLRQKTKETEKAARDAKRTLIMAKKGLSKDTKICVAIVGNFMRKEKPAEFRAIIHSSEFDKFLNRKEDRERFKRFRQFILTEKEEKTEQITR